MAGQRPRQGWIYMVNPYIVSLTCRNRHTYIYHLTELGDINCKQCSQSINSSRILRGEHPYLIWESDEFQDREKYIQTFTAIPLTSQTTYAGLSTVYPITPTTSNGLSKTSYALVHQICAIDGNCFKDQNGDWQNRIGQISKEDKEEIKETLRYYLNLDNNPKDWLKKNISLEFLEELFDALPDSSRKNLIEKLIDKNF